MRKVFKSVSLVAAIYGFAGWFYIAENAVFHQQTLHLALTHLAPFPHEDTFGAFCFAISIIGCFSYLLLREDTKTKLIIENYKLAKYKGRD